MPLDPQLAGLLAFLDASGHPPMEQGDPATARKAFRAMSVDLVKPDDVVPVGLVEELTAGGRPARLYRPESDAAAPTLVYFHGGGFVIGDLDTHDQTCRRLCRDTGTAVLSVDYRLAPEHPFPAAVDDALAATRWAADHLAELGGADVLAVGGDSAGGNLAAVVAQAMPDRVAAQLLIYPATHVLGDYPSRTENAEGYFLTAPMMTWFITHYAGGHAGLDGLAGVDLDDPRFSPHLGELVALPPAVVATAEFDPLRDEGEAYARGLREAGVRVDQVRYDGLIHGFVDMGPFSDAAAAAVDDLAARFTALLGT
jgi:acetyl esterase